MDYGLWIAGYGFWVNDCVLGVTGYGLWASGYVL